MKEIIEDLSAEQEALDSVVARINESSWQDQTPAVGWNISDQVGHLTFFDQRATMAITDRPAFTAELSETTDNIDAYLAGHGVMHHRSILCQEALRTSVLSSHSAATLPTRA
jgi:hypothetical protein